MIELDGTVFFFGTLSIVHCPLSNFLNMQDVSEAGLFLFSGREAPNLVDCLDRAIVSH